MIHDIKVFDKHGNLKEVINGLKIFQEMCEDTAKSPYLMERKKTKKTFICRFCKEEFPRNSPVQFCCKQQKCIYQRQLEKYPRKGGRKITCVICKKKVTVTHSRAITCSTKCSKEHNRRNNLINGLSFRVKERRKKAELKRKEMACQK